MSYKFFVSPNCDIVFRGGDDKPHNFGYNYVLKFPIMPWLHNLQCRKYNIFDAGHSAPKNKTFDLAGYEREITEEAIIIAKRLPVSQEEFNNATFNARFSYFTDWSETSYEFRLDGDRLILSTGNEKEEILSLTPDLSETFARKYIDFFMQEPNLSGIRYRMRNIIRTLGDIKVNK
jgi:hypothetical protein